MRQRTILAVDDEPAVRDLIHALLVRQGHFVQAASSGAEALGKLESVNFELVITDLQMPEMNGEQLAREIKKRRPSLPIVLLTGQKPESVSADFALVIAKPFTGLQLKEAVERLTTESSSPPHSELRTR